MDTRESCSLKLLLPRFLPAAGVMVIIFCLSHTPGRDLPSLAHGLDKVCHAIAYGALAASCLYAITPASGRKCFPQLLVGVVFFCFLYGLSDEFHQSFIPGRTSSWLDIAADTTGAALVVFIRYWWRHRGALRRPGKSLSSV